MLLFCASARGMREGKKAEAPPPLRHVSAAVLWKKKKAHLLSGEGAPNERLPVRLDEEHRNCTQEGTHDDGPGGVGWVCVAGGGCPLKRAPEMGAAAKTKKAGAPENRRHGVHASPAPPARKIGKAPNQRLCERSELSTVRAAAHPTAS